MSQPADASLARDAYVWAEIVDRVLDWEAMDVMQRQRAEAIALLLLSSAPPPQALRDLASMTNGVMADTLRRAADSLERRPPRREEDEPR